MFVSTEKQTTYSKREIGHSIQEKADFSWYGKKPRTIFELSFE
jgi:hypothetical protein